MDKDIHMIGNNLRMEYYKANRMGICLKNIMLQDIEWSIFIFEVVVKKYIKILLLDYLWMHTYVCKMERIG